MKKSINTIFLAYGIILIFSAIACVTIIVTNTSQLEDPTNKWAVIILATLAIWGGLIMLSSATDTDISQHNDLYERPE